VPKNEFKELRNKPTTIKFTSLVPTCNKVR